MRKKTQTDAEDGFLSRWSAVKSQADQPVTPVNDDADEDKVISPPQPGGTEMPDQPAVASAEERSVLGDEDMPEIDSLDEKSDYSGFLSPGVSDELRKLALRKLFRSQLFNVRDGLDDYDDDFRSFAALGDLITSDMRHQMELAEERIREMEEQNAQQAAVQQEPAAGDERPGEDQGAQADAVEGQAGHQQVCNEQANSGDDWVALQPGEQQDDANSNGAQEDEGTAENAASEDSQSV